MHALHDNTMDITVNALSIAIIHRVASEPIVMTGEKTPATYAIMLLCFL